MLLYCGMTVKRMAVEEEEGEEEEGSDRKDGNIDTNW